MFTANERKVSSFYESLCVDIIDIKSVKISSHWPTDKNKPTQRDITWSLIVRPTYSNMFSMTEY